MGWRARRRDALIDYDSRVLERDEHGKPVSRWDGETMKVHPVTGRKVPDEGARVEVYRYVKPRAAKWPKADFIVGNPPFIGGNDVRPRLGDGYFQALFATTDVPESADFVMHWWDKAALAVRKGLTRRFGLVTTNSITQVFSRRVIGNYLEGKDRLSLSFAIPNHPWVDEKDGAAVRIAMTVAEKGKLDGLLMTVTDESAAPENISFSTLRGSIGTDLRVGAGVAETGALKSNLGLAAKGIIFLGDAFLLSPDEQSDFVFSEADHWIKGYVSGRDLTTRSRNMKIIDVDHLEEFSLRENHPQIYQRLFTLVKPFRDQDRDRARREMWWKFGRRNTELRSALGSLNRYIATTETSRRRVFQFIDCPTLPDQTVIAIAIDDAFLLGVLSSRIHARWALIAGGRLGVGDDPRYNKTRCFDPFPFPSDVPQHLRDRIRVETEALDSLRKRVLADNPELTLTKLYNVLEALRANRPLTDAEREIHDSGLVTLIRQHHDAIDALVAEAYGWPADLTDEEILVRLVGLNKQRAAEEAKGHIRWLRPEYQAPDYAAPVNQRLDLGEAIGALPDNIIPWPASLPDQVSAVQSVLAGSSSPLAAQDVARAFKGKRAATVRPVLDALTGIGMARRLTDGRYAA